MLNYILLLIGLIGIEVIYFKIATVFDIIDKPNQRSLHSKTTIRGGGIIFFIAAIFYFVNDSFSNFYFFIGLFLVALISFIDDVFTLSNRYRLLFQILGIYLLLYDIQFYITYSHWWFLPFTILGVGILNAYNFMDGVNGITGAYSLIMLSCLSYINNFTILFIKQDFLTIIIISVLVFLIFNFRKKAICFGGDVGSISIAFILIFFVSRLIYFSHEWKFILLFAIYGIDTIYTILYRLQLKQNIFKAHKLHFFQLLVYQYGLSHLQVASLYAAIQLLLNIWFVNQSASTMTFYIPLLALIIILHLLRKKQDLAITIK